MGKKKSPPPVARARGQQEHENAHNHITNTATTPDRPPTDYLNVPAVPNTDAALDFLSRWQPEGPWALTAIKTDKKSIHGRLFTKDQFADMAKWIKEHNGKFNMYFTVNAVMQKEFLQKESKHQKVGREHIQSMDWLHVDIDARPPQPTEDAEKHNNAEFARIGDLLTAKLPQGIPKPTCITFSGGGFQAFWKLAEPVPINGIDAAYEDAKLYNMQLELVFGGDNCHNVDRIMRLPGTINIPDAKKLKKGRKPTLAKVVRFNDDIYPLAAFVKAAPVQISGSTAGGGASGIRISGNIGRIADVNELDQWGVEDRVKVIIVQGHHPEETKEPPNDTRSDWLFDALCNLYRKAVPDDVVYSLITDKDYGISASVLDKGSNIEKYAVRQMARAKEAAIEPWLSELNARHFVIGNDGGKCRVMEEIVDPILLRPRLTRQSFDDFRNRYMNKYVKVGEDDEGKPIRAPVGKWWLAHEQRRYYDTIVFAPERDVPGAYNLWQGFAFNSIQGDKHESFLRHLRDNVCRGDEAHYRYLLGWMARAVQRPGEQGNVAVVLRGGRGVGKGFMAKHFGKLFGRHFLHISNSDHLTGHFNLHLRDCVVLFADEAFFAGDRKSDRTLKTLVTEDLLAIEGKGQDTVQSPNFLHIVMATNDEWAVRAGEDERRYFVLDVGADKQQDTAYFTEIEADLLAGGYENLLHFLRTYDLSGFEVRKVPKTSALRDQQTHTRPAWVNVIIAMAEDGVSPDHDGWKPDGPAWVSAVGILEQCSKNPDDKSQQMTVSELLKVLAVKEATRTGEVTPVKRNIGKTCISEPNRPPIPVRENENYPGRTIHRVQRRMYQLPPLQEVRATLDKMGLQGEWDDSVLEWLPRGDTGWTL